MITRIRVKNYRGIEALDAEVAPTGAVVRGRNASGKTSVLSAIKAALTARDIGPEAIRRGADKAEILVDIDHHSVRRAITTRTSSVTVTKDGMKATAPQAYLRELLGTSSLDPMDLLTLKGKDRTAKVLEALPCTVTPEQLRKYVPKLKDDFDCSGHGLEVLERLRKRVYDARYEANAKTRELAAEAERAKAAVEQEAGGGSLPSTVSLDAAAEALRRSQDAYRALCEQALRADEYRAKSSAARDKILQLRADATRVRASVKMPAPVDISTVEQVLQENTLRVERLRAELEEAEKARVEASQWLAELSRQREAADTAIARAQAIEDHASALEATLAEVAIESPTAEALGTAKERVRLAEAQFLEAGRAARLAAFMRVADEAVETANRAAAEADRLDAIHTRLVREAPADLLSSSDSIPGLALAGDDITLDGVSLDSLSGAEQIRICVDVARRANAKSKILIVDGLERLDPDQYSVFVTEATRGGWQLLATRVDAGDMLIEAIQPEGKETNK